jgi:uncharacterized protein YkwD
MMLDFRQRLIALKTIPEAQSVRFLYGDSTETTDATSSAPSHGTVSPYNNHHLVNTSRVNHSLQPLTRTVHLDTLAKAHAQSMALRKMVFHSVNSVTALRDKLESVHVGENIQRGESISLLHEECMSQGILRANVLSREFDEMGMATAVGTDGIVYLVQLFRAINA